MFQQPYVLQKENLNMVDRGWLKKSGKLPFQTEIYCEDVHAFLQECKGGAYTYRNRLNHSVEDNCNYV